MAAIPKTIIRADYRTHDRLTDILDTNQGSAISRLLTPSDIIDEAVYLESDSGPLAYLPVGARKGATAIVHPDHVVPNSYGGTARQTAATLTRYATGWAITSIDRVPCRTAAYGLSGTDHSVTVWLTQEQADIQADRWRQAHRVNIRRDMT